MDFKTTVKNDYQWPFVKPIVGKPCDPPTAPPPPSTQPPPVLPYCHCDAYSYGPRVEQYKQLLEKEQKLCEDYELLSKQILDVRNDLASSNDTGGEGLMTSTYQSHYKTRAFPTTDYRAIIAASQSKTPTVESSRQRMLRCYEDPTHFNFHPPAERPSIYPKNAPKVKRKVEEYPGHTEYMDTFSATAVKCWKSMQKRTDPLPSAVRKADDRCA